MPSDSRQYVPALVYAGPTPYRHVAKGKKDLYIPYHIASQCEREGRPFPAEHTWRYGVSPDDQQLVFFYNMATKRSVWTLPAVDEGGVARELTQEETMRSEGRSLSAAARGVAPSPDEAGGATGRTSPVTASTAAPTTGKAATTVSTAEPTVSSGEPASAVQQRLAAWRAKNKDVVHPVAEGESGASTQPQLQPSSTAPQPLPVSRAAAREAEPAPTVPRTSTPPASTPQSNPVDAQARTTPFPSTTDPSDRVAHASPPTATTGVDVDTTPCEAPATAASPLTEEAEELRRAELTLQKEKVAALRAEALAAQRQWRARQVQADEEAACAQLAKRRRQMEQLRLEKEEALAKAKSDALADEGAKHAEVAATQQVNRFIAASAKVEASAQAHREAATTFGLALAQQLQSAAAAVAASPVPPANHSDALQEVVQQQKDSAKSSHRTTATTTSSRIHGTVRYSPAFVYTGDLLHRGRPTRAPLTQTESLLLNAVPDGSGRLSLCGTELSGIPAVNDGAGTASPYYYDGQWRDGLPHGRGTMSLPRCLVEGEWCEGKLGASASPPAQVQTKHLRGLVSMRDGQATGAAHVELDNGAVFTGDLQRGQPTRRGASLLLPNGDLIEWLTPSTKTRKALEGVSLTPTLASAARKDGGAPADGCGAARLRLANGDLYVGEVSQFVPHGLGHCVFQEAGHEYRGEFSRGWMEGRGTYTFANGDIYIGELRHGVFHGRGALLRKGAFLYEGDWTNGEMHGQGTLTFADTGDVWEGSFAHNQRAQGKYTHCAPRPPTPPRDARKGRDPSRRDASGMTGLAVPARW